MARTIELSNDSLQNKVLSLMIHLKISFFQFTKQLNPWDLSNNLNKTSYFLGDRQWGK